MIHRISVRVERSGPDLTDLDYLRYVSHDGTLYAIMQGHDGLAFQDGNGIVHRIRWEEIVKGIHEHS